MPHITTCTRCGRATRYAGLGTPPRDDLCPACWAFEVRDARIAAELAAGRLPNPDDLEAQAQHIERETAAALADLAAALRDDDPPGDGEPTDPATMRQWLAEAEALDPDPDGRKI
jgi:hypothetical protein